uniref:TIGR04255 family protein n=1 Tax=Candidatus Scatocola faecigallinarum TaxID=2840916 RepID=UPI0040251570
MSFFDNDDVSNLPKKVRNPRVLAAVIEIRFDSRINAEKVAWPLAEKLKQHYNEPSMLPSASIPREIRQKDRRLQNIPLYVMEHKETALGICVGDGMLSLTIRDFKYDTKDNFIKNFMYLYDNVKGMISNIRQLNIRYINMVDKADISPDSFNFKFEINNKTVLNVPWQSTCEFDIDSKKAKVVISNNIKYVYKDKTGSKKNETEALVLDIDVVKKIDNFEDDKIEGIIRDAQLTAKKIFFGLCSKKYIENVLVPVEL